MVVAAHGPQPDPNRARNLGFFFDASVRAVPDKVAVIDLFGGRERQITYRALDARMDRVAAMLAGLGAQAGERIGVLVGNRVEFLEVFFGAMRLGAIPVILNTRLAADTLGAIFADAGCRIAVIDPDCSRHAVAIAERLPLAHRIALAPIDDSAPAGFLAYEDALAAAGPAVAPPPLGDDAQAFQPYTSGSTGRPKGAIMTHRGMLWYVAHNQRHWPASPQDRGCVALPLFHKNALRGTVKPMLFAGGSFVLMPGFDAEGLCGGARRSIAARSRAGSPPCSPWCWSSATISTRSTSRRCARCRSAPRWCRPSCSPPSSARCRT